jgi:diketogulonate reductase-like aldo/keto reductase
VEYRQLGKSGEKVSTIGMGTWRMGAYGSAAELARQVSALRRGIELGMTLIDTAEIYAAGRAEEIVGDAIKGNRENLFIATKVAPQNLHYDDVISACEGSLRRMRIDRIDLYQVHWPNPSIPITETMAAMEELVRAGKIRHIGVSNFSVWETQEAQDSLSRSQIVSNQVEYSIRNRGVEKDILPYCEREGLSLIAYTPLAHGNIPNSAVPRGLIQKYGMTPAQVALNWVTRSQSVLAIPKSATLSHTEENAGSVNTRMTASEYNQITRSSSH